MVTRAGPLATINCEPRQARKGAAAAVISGAGVWLVRVASILTGFCLLMYFREYFVSTQLYRHRGRLFFARAVVSDKVYLW